MRRPVVVIALAVIMAAASGSAGAELSGYFEPQYFGFMLDGSYRQMQSNKLRVDLTAPYGDVRFAGNFDFINYNGFTSYNLLDFLPDETAAEVPDSSRYLFDFVYQDTVFLDNACLKLAFRRFDLTVGRQQVSYGSGYAWNPTDVFNTKDVLDPTYEQPGVNALRLDLPLPKRFTLTGVLSPEDDWDASVLMGRLKGNLKRFDYAFTAARVGRWTTVAWQEGDFGTTEERRELYGFDCVGEALGLGVWLEGGWNRMEVSDDYGELVLGSDYTLEGGVYLMGEYLYNGQENSGGDHTLSDWFGYFSGVRRSLSRHTVFGLVTHPTTDLATLGLSGIWSVDDGGVALVPQLNWSLFQDVELTLLGNLFAGGKGSAFNEKLGSGGLVRLRGYF